MQSRKNGMMVCCFFVSKEYGNVQFSYAKSYWLVVEQNEDEDEGCGPEPTICASCGSGYTMQMGSGFVVMCVTVGCMVNV